jgi:hypothetical protein
MNDIIKQIENLFKNNQNKWSFLNETTTGGTNVQLKFYVGVKETDVQIFKIDGIYQNIGFNYGLKTKTKKAIIETLTQN